MEIRLVGNGTDIVIASNYDVEASGKITISTDELQRMMCMSRKAAVMIGNEAHAKIVIDGHTEWDMKKLQDYLYNGDE